MPIAALPELLAYQDLVTEIAKALFRREHPTRRRVPKGFDERLGLRLTDVETGSAVPVLVRTRSQSELDLFTGAHIDDEYDRARDFVALLPGAAAERADVPEGFPDVPAKVLAGFGQTLRDDESIQLGSGGSWSEHYTKRARRHLLLRRQNSYTASTTLVGVLAEMNFESRIFILRTQEGFRVRLPYDDTSFDIIRSTVEPRPEKAVQVEGTVVFDQYDRPQRVDTIDAIFLAEDEAVEQAYEAARSALDDSAILVQGWLGGGEGTPVTTHSREMAAVLIDALDEAGDPAPRVYPTPESGISLEWTVLDRHIVAEVGADGALWLHHTDVTARGYDEQDFPPDTVNVAASSKPQRLGSVT